MSMAAAVTAAANVDHVAVVEAPLWAVTMGAGKGKLFILDQIITL